MGLRVLLKVNAWDRVACRVPHEVRGCHRAAVVCRKAYGTVTCLRSHCSTADPPKAAQQLLPMRLRALCTMSSRLLPLQLQHVILSNTA